MLKLSGTPIIVMLLIGLLASPAVASSPTELIQETVQQVINVVASSSENEGRRRELLRASLMPRFDWLEMSKQALGKNWNQATGRESEFVSAFAGFLGNAYIGQIASYRNEKVLFVQEFIERNQAQVKTKIVSENGEPTAIDYRLHRVDGEWKIYDVVVEDISIIANFRSQFRRILAKGSFEDLMRQLKEKDLKSKG